MTNKTELLIYLHKHYPNTDNEALCAKLGISSSALRTLASRNNISKSESYKKRQHETLMKRKEEKYLASIPVVTLTETERNILVGSILGDGCLSFAPRSRNAYYREHFSVKQKEYREWKLKQINSIPLRFESQQNLKSPSHPVFTELYHRFYRNNQKTITKDNITLLNHPIGLACLYLDDGTFIINAPRKRNTIYIYGNAGITTLCFSKQECEILQHHILTTFGVDFSLCPHPSGKGITLKTTKLEETKKFFELIVPYCKNVTCLQYKWDLDLRLEQRRTEIKATYGDKYGIRFSTTIDMPKPYSENDINLIIELKSLGIPDKEIAQKLKHSYWGVVDKIRRLRRSGYL
jgi:hypothetical protein